MYFFFPLDFRITIISTCSGIAGTLCIVSSYQRVPCHLQDPLKGAALVYSLVFYFFFCRKGGCWCWCWLIALFRHNPLFIQLRCAAREVARPKLASCIFTSIHFFFVFKIFRCFSFPFLSFTYIFLSFPLLFYYCVPVVDFASFILLVDSHGPAKTVFSHNSRGRSVHFGGLWTVR